MQHIFSRSPNNWQIQLFLLVIFFIYPDTWNWGFIEIKRKHSFLSPKSKVSLEYRCMVSSGLCWTGGKNPFQSGASVRLSGMYQIRSHVQNFVLINPKVLKQKILVKYWHTTTQECHVTKRGVWFMVLWFLLFLCLVVFKEVIATLS